ncbi:hypothetical protein E2320_009415 [Naja naja]|nr:hypothetical protein E2320_009415 [Naja naja]
MKLWTFLSPEHGPVVVCPEDELDQGGQRSSVPTSPSPGSPHCLEPSGFLTRLAGEPSSPTHCPAATAELGTTILPMMVQEVEKSRDCGRGMWRKHRKPGWEQV